MPSIEDLLRDSLRQRAVDVEPSPELWREVDRRITRRRRLTVATWSLAGAAAALAAIVVVPGLFASPDLDIEVLDRLPDSGVVPDTLVADVDGRLELRDLTTGDVLPFDAAAAAAAGGYSASELVVRPGSSREDFAIVAIRGGDGDQPAFVEVASREPSDSGGSDASSILPETDADPTFRPSVVWAPDADAVALTLPSDGDGARVVLWPTPHPGDLNQPGEAADVPADAPSDVPSELPASDVGLVLEREARLLAWVGSTTQTGDASWMWIRRPDGTVVTQELVLEADGSFRSGSTEPVQSSDPLLDVATSFAAGGRAAEPLYMLTLGEAGSLLRWSGEGDRGGAVRLGSLLMSEPEQLWLDAKQDAALVGDGELTWLVAHDGDGNFAAPVALPDGSARAALFDAPRPGAEPEPDVDQPDFENPDVLEPDDDPEEDPSTDESATTPGAELPEPVLIGSGRELRLLGSGREQTLLTMADEGESWIMGVAVRPGSTVDDLTAAVLTMAEGMWDLRELRVVDGEVSDVTFLQGFPPAYRPGVGSSAGEGFAVTGPVWSPDGDSLAWLELGAGSATLKVIGWSDGPGTGNPATDNAAFSVEAPGGVLLRLQEWVEASSAGAGATEIRAVSDEPGNRSYSIPLLRQSDGAWSQSSDLPTLISNAGPPGVAAIVALTSGESDPDVRWMVRVGDGGAELLHEPYGETAPLELPADLLPEEGLPTLWVRSIGGDEALVGSANTDRAYFVASDGSMNRLPGGGAWADVVR